MNYKLLAYAQDFSSFLVEKIKNADKIKQIILFGSTARGESIKTSDIDIFIECDSNLEKEINEIKEEFFKSVKFTKYWKLLGINNEINIIVGHLEEWGDLQRSIIANGIVIYGKYLGKPELIQYYLFILTPGKNRNNNISLWRKLYGYTQKINNKAYEQKGLIKELNGEKLARAVFIIPIENVPKIISFLKEKKITFKLIPFWKE